MLDFADRSLVLVVAACLEAAVAYPDPLFRAIGHPVTWFGAVIATRAVVTRDVPPYAIVAGAPARLIRKRFDEATISALLDIRWWDWDPHRVSEHLSAIRSGDVDHLIAAADK